MTFEFLLLAVHILLAIVILGPLVTYGVVVPGWIKKGPEMASPVQAVVKTLDHIGKSTGLILVFGIFLVMKNGTISFSDGWVGASMGLFILAMINGAVFIAPTANKAVAKLLAGERADAEAGRLRIFNTIAAVILVVILWLMVKKPGA